MKSHKIRVGAKYVKKFEKIAKTPYQRLMESEHIGQGIKDKLQKEHAQLNPMIMKIEIDRLRDVLYETQKKFGGQNTEKSPENSNKLR